MRPCGLQWTRSAVGDRGGIIKSKRRVSGCLRWQSEELREEEEESSLETGLQLWGSEEHSHRHTHNCGQREEIDHEKNPTRWVRRPPARGGISNMQRSCQTVSGRRLLHANNSIWRLPFQSSWPPKRDFAYSDGRQHLLLLQQQLLGWSVC